MTNTREIALITTNKLFVKIIGVLLLLIACNLHAETIIKGVRLWRAPDNTRIVFDLSGPAQHNMFMLNEPNRMIIDINNIKLSTSLNKLNLKNTPIKSIRNSSQNGKDLRLVFDLSSKVTPKVFSLAPNAPYGDRLVVDLFNEQPSSTNTTQQPTQAVAPTTTTHTSATSTIKGTRDIIIAIDPGHGGEDPGAIGSGRKREKDVVLQIARRLQAQINRKKGFRAELTRKGDYFIPLRQRPQIARKIGADLFISIHADAAPQASASGASVFAISGKGATSETARWLADTENRSDLIGGAGSVSLDGKDQVLAGVLLDLSMTAVMSSSLDVGQKVLDNIGKTTKLHKRRVEQAGFVVLKSPDIPSILVETGFISNPTEARKLFTASHQQALVTGITNGVSAYFYKNPPPGTYLDQLRHGSSQAPITSTPRTTTTTHKVVRGDSLSGLATRYGVKMSDIKSANNLKSNNIQIGQTLKIPAR